MKKLIWTLCVMVWSLAGFAQEKSYQLSSHILDILQGQPAAGVKISLSHLQPDGKTWALLEERLTDENGRVKDFLEEGTTDHKSIYSLTYHVALRTVAAGFVLPVHRSGVRNQGRQALPRANHAFALRIFYV